MNLVVFLFGSGAVFFIGIGFVSAGLAITSLFGQRWLTIVATLVAVVGLFLIVMSATPLPYWLYVVSGGTTLLWLVAERSEQERFKSAQKWLRGLVAVLWTVCAAVEIPYRFMPALVECSRPTLYIIGDSVTAGMSDSRKDTWPAMLTNAHPVEVIDLSQIGATVASAMKQADSLPAEGGLILLEIGGNDLLGSTSVKQFERDLDALLGRICKSKRTVLMFELPLPPLCNDYGRIQRLLAAKFGVLLIPKRVFIAVLSEEDATLDSIHLTTRGHERMAGIVWSLIKPAYGE